MVGGTAACQARTNRRRRKKEMRLAESLDPLSLRTKRLLTARTLFHFDDDALATARQIIESTKLSARIFANRIRSVGDGTLRRGTAGYKKFDGRFDFALAKYQLLWTTVNQSAEALGGLEEIKMLATNGTIKPRFFLAVARAVRRNGMRLSSILSNLLTNRALAARSGSRLTRCSKSARRRALSPFARTDESPVCPRTFKAKQRRKKNQPKTFVLPFKLQFNAGDDSEIQFLSIESDRRADYQIVENQAHRRAPTATPPCVLPTLRTLFKAAGRELETTVLAGNIRLGIASAFMPASQRCQNPPIGLEAFDEKDSLTFSNSEDTIAERVAKSVELTGEQNNCKNAKPIRPKLQAYLKGAFTGA